VRRHWSLANRVSLVTLVSVSATTLVLTALSLWGVYRVVSSEHDVQVRVYRRLLADNVSAGVALVDRAMASASSDAVEQWGGGRPFAGLDAADARLFLSLSMHARDGKALAYAVSDGASPPEAVTARVATAQVGATDYMWIAPQGTSPGQLWAIHAYAFGSSRRAIVGLVDLAFLRRALDQPVTWTGSVVTVVLDPDGRCVMAIPEGSRLDAGKIRFGAGESTGSVTASLQGAGTVPGTWGTLLPTTDLAWRVVVLDTRAGPWDRARAALTPAGIVMGLIALVAVATAYVFSRRLIAPLRLLERAARDVAAGGYVRPVDVKRDDEIGRVADAFNDIGVRLNSLQDMARLVASADNTDEVLDACLNALGHILGSGDAAVLLADEAGASLHLARGRGLAAPDTAYAVWMSEASPLVECFTTQRPVRFGGSAGSPGDPVHELFGASAQRLGVVVPLTAGTDALGVTVVLAAGRRQITESQLETLTAFNANAAVAIRTSRLFGEEQVSRREAEALRSVAELTAPVQELGVVLRSAGGIAARLLGYDISHVVLDRREELGLTQPVDPEGLALLGAVWSEISLHDGRDPGSNEPIFVSDASETVASARHLAAQWRSMLFIPLVYESSAWGAVVLLHRTRRESAGSREMSAARSIGQQLALALRNAHLLQDARRRAENLETVFKISQAVSSELQATVVLNRVLDVVQRILSADTVSLMSFDEVRGALETTMARGVVSRPMLGFRVKVGEDVPGEVVESGAPVVLGGLAHRPTVLAGLAADEGLESLLAVPLLARGRAIGVLTAFSKKRDAFSADDMELLSTFASQAALALDTAALYGREHHIATVLQQSILPTDLPEVPGLESASFYLPSGREAEIGGDYYDVFTTHDGRIALAIADVCGKGVKAATKTSMVKYSLRGLLGAGLGPSAALRELNRELFDAGDPSDIVTVWLGVLDIPTGRLRYASGGHPAGLVRRHDSGDVERLPATGPLLGAVVDARIDEVETTMSCGDILLLCTDGVTEARRALQLFGEGRVRRALRSCTGSASDCVERLLHAVEDFASGPLRDDAAALAIRLIENES